MPIAHPAVAVRRLFARRPMLYWAVVALVAGVIALSVQSEVAHLRDARARWGDTTSVLVAVDDVAPGATPRVRRVVLPDAATPPSAVTALAALDERPARQRIAAGEIVTETDLAPSPGALALVPGGWRAVPITESPSSLAAVGDRVDVVSDGIVIVAGGIVVAIDGTTTLVAAPADDAPLVALAAQTGAVTLLRLP